MNDAPILEAIEPEIVETLIDRREAITRAGKASGFLAASLSLGSIPVALAALSHEAYGQAPDSVIGTLQFAFLLENLEAEFYSAVTGVSSVRAFNDAFAPVRNAITPVELSTLALIRDHERAHVQFLQAAILNAGGGVQRFDPRATFDFTGGRGSGGGPFRPATTDKNFLLAAAQVFEDTGVRAYKGQAGNLLRTGDLLTAAPWVDWGPYLWSYGDRPRADGLSWPRADFQSLGQHPSQSGEQKVASALLDFFATSPHTCWFRAAGC